MTTKLSHSDNPQLNERTMEQIAQRVADFKESKDRSKSSAEEVESHLGALSEVFHVKKWSYARIWCMSSFHQATF